MENRLVIEKVVAQRCSIDYVFVFKGYTIVVFTSGANEVIDYPLGALEELLRDQPFFRIHRSFLVNLKRLKELEIRNNKLLVKIRGHELPVSRRKKRQLLDILGAVN
ncbi:MAG: LytTR family transcriptional regulator [Bacteroidia bacterium]|nr:MAG: LytTR family transcriptional regulator [Bacteroidia bacterium]